MNHFFAIFLRKFTLLLIGLSAYAVYGQGPTGLGFTNLLANSVDLSWTAGSAGDGDSYLVVVREFLAPGFVPADGTDYTTKANTDNSLAGSVTGGGRVVKAGAGTTVSITGLTGFREYYVVVYQYDSSTLTYLDAPNIASVSFTTPGFDPELLVLWDFEDGTVIADLLEEDNANANNVGSTITFFDLGTIGTIAGAIAFTGFDDTDDYVEFAVDATDQQSVAFEINLQRSIVGGLTIEVQYSVAGGPFDSIAVFPVTTTPTNYLLLLPVDVNDESDVKIRLVAEPGTSGNLAIYDASFISKPVYFRTTATGNFRTLGRWEVSTSPTFATTQPARQYPYELEIYEAITNTPFSVQGFVSEGYVIFALNSTSAGVFDLGPPFAFYADRIFNFPQTANAKGGLYFTSGSVTTISANAIMNVGTEMVFGQTSILAGGNGSAINVTAGSIYTANVQGLVQGGTKEGSIQIGNTASRIYADAVDFIYVGDAPQTTRNNATTAAASIILNRRIVIDNPAGVQFLNNTIFADDNSELVLRNGALDISGRTLELQHDLTVDNGTFSTDGNTNLQLTNPAGAAPVALPAVFPFTTTSDTLGTLILDRASETLATAGDLTVNTLLQLTRGTLALDDNTLTIGGTWDWTSGNYSTTANTNLVLNGTGALNLTAAPQTLPHNVATQDIGNLTLNRSGVYIDPGTNLTVHGVLTLNNGFCRVGSGRSLQIATTGAVSGVGSSTSYVRLADPTATFGYQSASDLIRNYPVGTVTSWAPVVIDTDTPTRFDINLHDIVPGGFVSDASVSLVWELTRIGAAAASSDLTLRWPSSEAEAAFDPLERCNVYFNTASELQASPWTDASEQFLFPSEDPNGSDTFKIDLIGNDIFNGGSGTYYIAVANEQSTLPIELLSFDGERQGNDVALQWITATEINNDFFEVQRSSTLDFSDMQVVGTVAGNGTTSEPIAYSFLDREVADQTWYYRLRQVDYDGRFEYTHAIEILPAGFSEKPAAKWQLTPNPSTGSAPEFSAIGELVTPADQISITAVSTGGTVLYQGRGRFVDVRQAFLAALRNAPAGTYIITVVHGATVETIRHVRF